jgi:hypothetical protein
MDRIKDAGSAVGSKVASKLGSVVAKSGAVAVFVVVTLMLIVLIVAYVVWRMYQSEQESALVLVNPRRLNGQAKEFTFSTAKMPALYVGQDYSYSMWIYLSDMVATSQHKVVLMRKGQPNSPPSVQESLKAANPVVFMDKAVNKMYICARTTRPPDGAATTLDTLAKKEGASWLVATVDYVPLQRWVNVAFTVSNGSMTVYVDGSIYTVENLDDLKIPTVTGQGPQRPPTRPMFAPSTGDVIIGNPAIPVDLSDDVTGFVARVEFFNYAITMERTKSVFNKGPSSATKGIASAIGIPDYALRSPVYRVDDSNADETPA